MNAILEMALSNALVAGLMAVVVFGISRIFRRPALIHSLWLLVLIKLVTPPIVPVPIEVSWLERPSRVARPEERRAWPAVAPRSPRPSRWSGRATLLRGHSSIAL